MCYYIHHVKLFLSKKRGGILKLAKKVIIFVGIILIISYIVHVPSRTRNLSCKNSTVSLVRQSSRHSTVRRSVPNQIQIIFVLLYRIIPRKTHFIFDSANIFFAITHILVYHWQLARRDLSADATLSYQK